MLWTRRARSSSGCRSRSLGSKQVPRAACAEAARAGEMLAVARFYRRRFFLCTTKMPVTNRTGEGEKSLLCGPGSELRLGGREQKKGDDHKWDGSTIGVPAVGYSGSTSCCCIRVKTCPGVPGTCGLRMSHEKNEMLVFTFCRAAHKILHSYPGIRKA